MATKEISIILRAKNAMAAGLSKAGKALKSFGAGAVKWGKRMAVGFLAAGTAVAGMAAKALQAYSVQERAEKQLEAAMNARGEQGGVLIGIMKREAAAIQDATGAADEQTLATMAQLKTLGVATNQLGEAAKATIALKSIGLEGASAQRAVALAMQGNYDMLNRYIPAIRDATNEQQKAAAFNDLVTRGYQQQEAELQTVGGQWNALKGRIGDVWEELGKAIAQNGALTGAMQRAGDAVKAFGEKVSAWVEGRGLGRLMGAVQVFFLDMRQRWESAAADADVFFSSIRDNTVFKYLTNYVVSFANIYKQWFFYLKDFTVEVFNFIKSAGRDAFDPPSFDGVKNAYKENMEAIKGQNIEVTNHLEKALNKREKLEEKHAQEVNNLNANITARMEKEFNSRSKMTKQQLADAEAAAIAEAEAIKAKLAAEKKAAEEKLAAEKKLADDIKKLEDEKKQAQLDAQQAVLDDAKKAVAEQQKLANMRVQDFIDAAKEEKNIEKAKADEAKKAARLTENLRIGGSLSKKDQQWLDAFNKINDADKKGGGLDKAKAAAEAAQKKLEDLQGQSNRHLKQIEHDLGKQRAELKQLLAMQ